LILSPRTVLSWLNQFSHANLSPLFQRQLDSLPNLTRGFIFERNALVRNARHALNPLERAEILLNCAVIEEEHGELEDALQHAAEAEEIYAAQPRQLHRQATAAWIGGAIAYRLNQNLLAYSRWLAARRAFEDLARQAKRRRTAQRARWYDERLTELRAELAGRIEEAFSWLYLFRENRSDDLDWLLLDHETRRRVLEGSFERDVLPLEVWLRVQSGTADWFGLPPQVRRRIQQGNLDLYLRRLFDDPAPQVLASQGSLALTGAAGSYSLPGKGTQMADSDPHLRQLLPAESSALIRRQYIMRILRLIQPAGGQTAQPRYASAYELMRELESLTAKQPHPHWQADTHTELAFFFYQMGMLDGAEDYLHKAIAGYPAHSHQQAVACWMLGLVYAAAPQKQAETVRTWQRALALFEEQMHRADRDNQQNACRWYRERIPILRMLVADRIQGFLTAV
jgi:tetratricopeptide (TPR) repeat protein